MKFKSLYLAMFFGWGLLLASVSSCINEPFTTNPKDKLMFSSDTIKFDTIFSSIPSITRKFKVYNRNNKAININKIFLENGTNTSFRFNADGYTSGEKNMLENIVVGAKDSIFVYVETTLKNNQQNKPIYISDNLVFSFNNNLQKVVLEAYGQDAIILRNHTLKNDETFTKDKPYLIFGYLYVPPDKTLTMEAGTRVFMHKEGNSVVNTSFGSLPITNTCFVVEGSIIAEGQTNSRISIRGDRFDEAYEDLPYSFLPSQWGTIYLVNTKKENRLINIDIVGGDMGVVLVGNSNNMVNLKIENAIMHSIAKHGVLSQFGDVQIINTEISNCGSSAITQWGGKLMVTHSTIANYMPSAFVNEGNRNEAAVNIVSFIRDNNTITAFPITACVIENSIIYGNLQNELSLRDTSIGIPFNVFINTCMIKSSKIERPELQNIYWSVDLSNNNIFKKASLDLKRLKEEDYFNFQLADNSPAQDKANLNVARKYPFDLLGKNRFADSKPDLGAYEK